MRVAVIEGELVGGGATAAGMGHIVVMDDSPAQLALTKYSRQLWQELLPQLPAAIEYRTTGTIWVAADDEEMHEILHKQAIYAESGILSDVLDANALQNAEPNLSPALLGGLLVPQDAVLYPPCAARFLLDRAIERKAAVIHKSAVSMANGRVLFQDGSSLDAPRLVNAAGADAPALTPGLPIRKRKGHLVITDRYPGFVRHQLVELGYLKSAGSANVDSVAFNVQPRQTGQIMIGSSRQYDADGNDIDREILQRMMQRTHKYLPGIHDLSMVRAWTGFRAATPDKLPLIGPVLLDPTLFLAAGHEGLGITTALATARLLVEHFMGRPSAIPNGPYLPSRSSVEVPHA